MRLNLFSAALALSAALVGPSSFGAMINNPGAETGDTADYLVSTPGNATNIWAAQQNADPTFISNTGDYAFVYVNPQLNAAQSSGTATLVQGGIAVTPGENLAASFVARGLTNDEAGGAGLGLLSNTNNSSVTMYDAQLTLTFNDGAGTVVTSDAVDMTTSYQLVSIPTVIVPADATEVTFQVGIIKPRFNANGGNNNTRGVIAVDDLAIGASTVPEPTAAAAFVLAVVGGAIARRRS